MAFFFFFFLSENLRNSEKVSMKIVLCHDLILNRTGDV